MQHGWIVGALLAATFVLPAAAQQGAASQQRAGDDVVVIAPPDRSAVAEPPGADPPQSPIGPRDVLNQYENEMASVAQDTCDTLAKIEIAVRQNQISAGQAEYASGQTYALALMRFQMLSTLHEILDHELDNQAKPQSEPKAENKLTDSSPSSSAAQGSGHHEFEK